MKMMQVSNVHLNIIKHKILIDGNSNTKNNQSSRMHSNNDRRLDFRGDPEYNSQK